MRTYRQAALAATLGLAPLAADAAPSSMLHTMPRTESSQDAGQSSGGMRWLTKWFRDEEPQPAGVVTPPGGGVPAVMAYQPPQAPQAPARGPMAPSIEAWGGFSPNVMVPTTPIASVAPNAAAPAPTPPSTPVAAAPTPTATPLPNAAQADAKTLRRRGHDLDRAGKLAEAELTYRQAIGADPTSAAAVNDLGLCLARQGKLEQSAAVLRQAIMMRPDKPLYRNNIATVLVELDQADEALVHLKTAYGPATAHYNLGQLLSRAGKTGDAVTQLRRGGAARADARPGAGSARTLDAAATSRADAGRRGPAADLGGRSLRERQADARSRASRDASGGDLPSGASRLRGAGVRDAHGPGCRPGAHACRARRRADVPAASAARAGSLIRADFHCPRLAEARDSSGNRELREHCVLRNLIRK